MTEEIMAQEETFDSLRNKRVLVTGASGFTGGFLAKALVQQGCQVKTLVRQKSAITDLVASRVELIVGDIRNPQAVDKAVEGCDIVFHLAAWYRDASVAAHIYHDINVLGTENVLQACEKHKVSRLIHCSTMGIHGGVSRIPSDETAPHNPGDTYQKSKLEAELRVWSWFKKTAIPTAIVRPAGIYGPGDMRFLKLFRAVQKGYFVMLGSGRTWFHPAHIDDLVQGFLLCAVKNEAVGEAFCFASDRPITLNELVAAVADVLGVSRPHWHLPVWPFYASGALCEAVCVPLGINPPIHRRRVGFFTHNRAFTTMKAQRLLGYSSRVTLVEGLRQTAAWYQTHGYLEPLRQVMRVAHA